LTTSSLFKVAAEIRTIFPSVKRFPMKEVFGEIFPISMKYTFNIISLQDDYLYFLHELLCFVIILNNLLHPNTACFQTLHVLVSGLYFFSFDLLYKSCFENVFCYIVS
jgi:hypothetical protein